MMMVLPILALCFLSAQAMPHEGHPMILPQVLRNAVGKLFNYDGNKAQSQSQSFSIGSNLFGIQASLSSSSSSAKSETGGPVYAGSGGQGHGANDALSGGYRHPQRQYGPKAERATIQNGPAGNYDSGNYGNQVYGQPEHGGGKYGTHSYSHSSSFSHSYAASYAFSSGEQRPHGYGYRPKPGQYPINSQSSSSSSASGQGENIDSNNVPSGSQGESFPAYPTRPSTVPPYAAEESPPQSYPSTARPQRPSYSSGQAPTDYDQDEAGIAPYQPADNSQGILKPKPKPNNNYGGGSVESSESDEIYDKPKTTTRRPRPHRPSGHHGSSHGGHYRPRPPANPYGDIAPNEPARPSTPLPTNTYGGSSYPIAGEIHPQSPSEQGSAPLGVSFGSQPPLVLPNETPQPPPTEPPRLIPSQPPLNIPNHLSTTPPPLFRPYGESFRTPIRDKDSGIENPAPQPLAANKPSRHGGSKNKYNEPGLNADTVIVEEINEEDLPPGALAGIDVRSRSSLPVRTVGNGNKVHLPPGSAIIVFRD